MTISNKVVPFRPDEWSGYHCGELCIECDTNPVDCNKHYEAGADAMLERIRDKIVNIGKEVGRDDLEFRIQVAAWICG